MDLFGRRSSGGNVINPDGSFEVTGVMKGGSGSLYESKGTIKVVNNKISLVFEGDKDVIEGRLELVAGKSLSIVLNEENDISLTYNYCENDLSDEIIGMWVSFGNSYNEENNMFIQTFNENGKSTYTDFGEIAGEIVVKKESNYTGYLFEVLYCLCTMIQSHFRTILYALCRKRQIIELKLVNSGKIV